MIFNVAGATLASLSGRVEIRIFMRKMTRRLHCKAVFTKFKARLTPVLLTWEG